MKAGVRHRVRRLIHKRVVKIQMDYGNFEMRRKGGFRSDNSVVPLMSAEVGNNYIYKQIVRKDPFLLVRPGIYEMAATIKVVYNIRRLNRQKVFSHLCINAGFFPDNVNLLDNFAEVYAASIRDADCFAASSYKYGLFKYEEKLYSETCPEAGLVDFAALNSFSYPSPWSQALADKKVLVVHPFAETIRMQYSRREYLFENKKVLPEFSKIETVKAVQSIAGTPTRFSTWFEALDFMCEEIDSKDYDIALIGAGAYGLPLAAHVRRMGKSAVHLGGITQMLFGIRGRRWENKYGYLFNDHWVRPAPEDVPDDHRRVENGCYW